MKSKKPKTDYPSLPAQSEEEESVKEQDEESEQEESASEHEEESGEEERSEGEEFKGGENIYESRTPNAKPQSQVNKMHSAQKQIVTLPQSSSDSGEEKEDEDEEGGDDELEISQHYLSASGFPIKFTTPTKPMPKESKSTSKRPLEDHDEEHWRSEKKAKGKAAELKKDEPSAISAAIGEGACMKWCDDDVKRLLRSIINLKTEKGLDPATNMTAFCKHVEGKFQREFSRIQIYEKIRRLKTKFFNSVRKFEKGGEESVFLEANELTVFKLSEKIWGGGNDDGMITTRPNKTIKWSGKIGSAKEDKKQERKKKNVVEPLCRDDNENDFQSKYPFLTQSFDVGSGGMMMIANEIAGGRSFLKENMSLIGHGKAKELDGKWKKMRKAEAELLLKRLELMEEHCSLVLEAMKK